MVYYNEIDPFAVEWLNALIAGGHIADGVVDARPIQDVTDDDVKGFTQCHFFAGIGGWSLALRLAGWPDDREVWTGSCPCQPFSSAGKQGGFDDSRHLWPVWSNLIAVNRPAVLFGEQVESAIAHGWLDLVQDDLEDQGYAVGAVGLPAASIGAPHIRQRLWFVADDNSARRIGANGTSQADGRTATESGRLCDACGKSRELHEDTRLRFDGCYPVCHGHCACKLAESSRQRREGIGLQLQPGQPRSAGAEVRRCGEAGELGDTSRARLQERECDGRVQRETLGTREREAVERGGDPRQLADADRTLASDGELQRGGRLVQLAEDAAVGFWSDADWIPCRDNKSRPVEPGTFPLATGVPNRVGRLRGYGNSIVPQVAAAFIKAYLSCC